MPLERSDARNRRLGWVSRYKRPMSPRGRRADRSTIGVADHGKNRKVSVRRVQRHGLHRAGRRQHLSLPRLPEAVRCSLDQQRLFPKRICSFERPEQCLYAHKQRRHQDQSSFLPNLWCDRLLDARGWFDTLWNSRWRVQRPRVSRAVGVVLGGSALRMVASGRRCRALGNAASAAVRLHQRIGLSGGLRQRL